MFSKVSIREGKSICKGKKQKQNNRSTANINGSYGAPQSWVRSMNETKSLRPYMIVHRGAIHKEVASL